MAVSIFVVVIILAVSIYDFYDSRNWSQLTDSLRNDAVFGNRNKAYGAYAMRKSYNKVMVIISLCFVLIFVSYISVNATFSQNKTGKIEPETVDTTLLSLNAPPIEPIETLPEQVEIEPNEPVKAEEINKEENNEKTDEPEKDITEAATSENGVENPINTTEKAVKDSKGASNKKKKEKKKKNTPEDDIKEFEKSLFANAQGVKERERIQKEMEERKRQREQKAQTGTEGKEGKVGSGTNSTKGAMVNWVLKGRTPHNNDEYFVRNPGYTCGKGKNGTILIKIKVDGSGDVKTAILANDSAEIDPCLVEQALKYAKMSRFNGAGSGLQEGTIEYTFISQN